MTEITLPVGCTAEHDTCGSCKFYKRDGIDGDRSYGYCHFRLPPPLFWVDISRNLDPEFERPPNYKPDTFGCDLYRSDGKTYIVQRKITPP